MAFFGGGNTTKDYEMMQAGTTPSAAMRSLVGHSFSNFNTENIDRVTTVSVEKQRGRIVEKQIVLRPARQLNVTFQVQCGSEGEQYTPLLQAARQNRTCSVDLYIKRLCPPNDDTAHFYALIEAILDPPTLVNELITINETTNIVAWQIEAQAPEMLLVWQTGIFRVLLEGSATPLYAVAPMTQACVDCDTGEFLSFVYGGGLGGVADEALLSLTDDRFQTSSALTHGIAVGSVVKGIFTEGDVIIVAFADAADFTTAVSGGTTASTDRGAAFTLDSNITVPVHDVDSFLGQYVAVGGAGGAQAMLWTGDNGVDWTSVSSVALPATNALHSIAVDKVNEAFYVCGENGTLLKGTQSGDTILLVALTPPSAGAIDLYRVAVLGPDHLIVAGASNYCAESFDGGDSWSQPSVPGSAAIYGVAGRSKVRSVVGSGIIIAERDVLSDNFFKTKTVQGGITITGDFMDLETLDGEYNYFIGCTDEGEVVISKPFYSGA